MLFWSAADSAALLFSANAPRVARRRHDRDGKLLLVRSAQMGGKLDALRVDRNGRLVGVTRLEERHTLDAGVVWNGSSYLVVWFALSTESVGGVLNSAILNVSSVLALSDNRLLFGRSQGPTAFSKAMTFTDDEIREMPALPVPPRVVSIRGIAGHADVSWTSGGPHADGYILTLHGPLLGVPTVIDRPATAGTFQIFDRLPEASIRAFNASGLSPLVPNRRRAAHR